MATDRPTAYLPNFEHELFISYAHVDDEPDLGPLGRVSKFFELLTKCLARLLGRRDCFSIWMDRTRLDATFRVTPGIEKSLGNCAVMVALVSNGYLASQWCTWEREVFLRRHGTSPGGSVRVFVVELDRLEVALSTFSHRLRGLKSKVQSAN